MFASEKDLSEDLKKKILEDPEKVSEIDFTTIDIIDLKEDLKRFDGDVQKAVKEYLEGMEKTKSNE